MQAYNPYLDFLIDPNLLRVSRFFALTIENEQKKKKIGRTGSYLPEIEVKVCNIMIAGRLNFICTILLVMI